MATNGRFIGNDPLTEFNNFAIPVTNANNNKDYRIEKAQLKQLVDNANVVSKDVKSGGKVGNELIASQNFVGTKVQELNTAIANNSKDDKAFAVKYATKISNRNLADVYGTSDVKEIFRRIYADMSFDTLMIGDYINLPAFDVPELVTQYGFSSPTLYNTSGNLRIRIGGFNFFEEIGYPKVGGKGILWVFENIAFKAPMNKLDTHSGNHTNAGGYKDSELRKFVNGAFSNALEKVVGKTIQLVSRLVDTHGNWAWVDEGEKCFIPSEVEIWGNQAWGQGGYYSGTSKQIPYYALAPNKILKHWNGSRDWYWEGTSDSSSSTDFCGVGDNGGAGNSGAGYSGGVSPAFYI